MTSLNSYKFVTIHNDAEIAYVDRQIQRLLDHLHLSGLDSHTLVVVVGDHGEGLGQHVEQTHGYTLYETTPHVPLIFRLPGRVSAGHRHVSPVSLVDLFPTLCEFLRLTSPVGISGRSFRPALNGKAVAPVSCYAATDDPFLQEGWSPLRSLTNEQWKFIRTTKPELFDLQNDPGEKQNLAEHNAEQLADMERQLQKMEQQMTIRKSVAVQLSSREQKALESLGYAGGGQGRSAVLDKNAPLIDVKDMLRDDVDARSAHELLHSGKTDQAIDALRKIVQRSPAHVGSRVFLGQALESYGDLPAAMMQYQAALKIKPDHIDALIHLGATHGTLGHLEQAVELFDAALQIKPDSATARLNLGRALRYLGRLDEAVANLEEALKLDSEMAGVQMALGEALRQLGRGDEAIPYLKEELRRTPRSIPARLNLAAILAEQQPDQAEHLLRDSLQLQPGNPHVHFQFGEFLLARSRPAEAMTAMQETLRLMPDHPKAAVELERARKLLK